MKYPFGNLELGAKVIDDLSINTWFFLNGIDDMSDGLKRLKSLGLGLQSEIDDQGDSIDSLMNKVDKMDLKIHNTHQQIKNLK